MNILILRNPFRNHLDHQYQKLIGDKTDFFIYENLFSEWSDRTKSSPDTNWNVQS